MGITTQMFYTHRNQRSTHIKTIDKYVSEVSSIFTFSSRFAKKVKSENTPKKLESSPTTHVTEISFLTF